MKLRSMCIIVVFLMSSFCLPVLAQSSSKIDNVDPGLALRAAAAALAEKQLPLAEQGKQRLVSGFYAYSAHLMQYRARFVFEVQGTTLTLTLDQKQQNTSSGWKEQLITAKGAEDKLLLQMSDRIRALLSNPDALPAGAVAVGAQPQPVAPGHPARAAAKPAIRPPSSDDQPYPDTSKAAHVAFDDDGRYYCKEGLCAVHRDRRLGFIDANGKEAIPFDLFNKTFVAMPSFHNGIARVSYLKSDGVSDAFKYIDKQGKTLFPGQDFRRAYPFAEGVALVARAKGPGAVATFDLQWSFIDKQGKQVSPVIPKTGLEVVEMNWKTDLEMPFHNGLIEMSTIRYVPRQMSETLTGYVNATGKRVIDGHAWNQMKPFQDGLAWVYSTAEGKWGAIDTTGKLVIPYSYQNEPGPFSEGLAAVYNRDGLACYIDKTNTIRVPCKYRGPASPFRDGNVIVLNSEDRKFYTVDKDRNQGKRIDWQICQGSELVREDGMYCIQVFAGTYGGSNWMIGLLKSNGEVVIPPGHFLFIGEFHDGLAYASAFPKPGVPSIQGFINEKFEFVILRDNRQF